MANTSQWQTFKARLDSYLLLVVGSGIGIDGGSYEGSELEMVADYALGYQCLKTSDPNTASKYADKALGLMSFGMTGLQKQLGNSLVYLARGDGTTTVFTLPNSNPISSSITVFLCDIAVATVVKGVANGADYVSAYSTFLKVSKTSDGSPDYVQNTDWRQTGDTQLGFIDWSLGSSNQPEHRAATFSTTQSSATLTSSDANFTSADVGRAVTDGGIGYFSLSGVNTVITAVTNSTTATISPVANATGTNFAGTVADIYYVTYYTDIYDNAAPTWTYNSGTNAVTLSTAPTSASVVVAEYVYGTWTGGVSTLGYQESSDGIGGFNSVYVDDTYPGRYLGKFLSIGLDWLDGYQGFSSSFKSQIITMLKRWANFLGSGATDGVNGGYNYRTLESNYGDGSYCSLCATAVALTGRDSSSSTYQTMATTLRTSSGLVAFNQPAAANETSLYGGFWLEGIGGYVAQAAFNLLEGGMILGQASLVTNTAEAAWAQQLMTCLAHAQITQTAITALPGDAWYFWGPVYDIGDGSNYPFLMPSERLFAVISTVCSGTAEASYARYTANANITLSGPLGDSVTSYTADWHDLLFYDPSGTSSTWTGTLPTQYYASAAGLVMARNDWTFTGTYASFQASNIADANGNVPDHQIYAQGHVTLWRGDDNLLVTASTALHNQNVTAGGGSAATSGDNKSSFCNLVITDDNGDGTQQYRWSQPAFWYGTGGSSPAVTVLVTDLQSAYVHAAANTLAAYTGPSSANTGGVLSEMVRSWLYIRPDLMFVYDRVTSRVPGGGGEYPKQQRWNVETTGGSAPTLGTNTLTHTRGSSKLFGTFYSSLPCTLSLLQTVNGEDGYSTPHDISQIVWQNTSTATRVTYLACWQADASTVSAYSTAHITSGTALEGALVNQTIAMFGAANTGQGPTGYLPTTPVSYSYTAPGGTVTHYVCDLAASHSYTLSGAVSGTATTTAAGVLTFTTTGSGSQTVTIT